MGTPLSTGTVATLSTTVKWGMRPEFCITYPMLRRSVTASRFRMLSSSISMSPLVGSTMRLIMRSSVVLPHPDDPTKTVVFREGMTRLKSSTARVPSGNSLVTLLNSIMARVDQAATWTSFQKAT